MIKEVARQLTQAFKKSPLAQLRSGPASPPSDVDPNKLTIRCLPHVIHLAVLDFLKAVAAISDEDAANSEYEPVKMTEAEAEAIAGDGSDEHQARPPPPPPGPPTIGTVIYKVSPAFIILLLTQNALDPPNRQACPRLASAA